MIKVLACKNKRIEDRLNSSSGGLFILVARDVINSGGVVYGAAFDENFSVIHVRVTEQAELEKLCNSKYSFSNFGNAMNQCEKDLKNDRLVLFVGSPCQIAALNRKLEKHYDNLFLMDFVCHGSPSAATWRKYLNEVSKGKKVANVNFRDKCKGWLNYHITIEYSDGTRYSVNHKNDLYMRAFMDNSILSEGCYSCKYKGIENRSSDITLGDYWGADLLEPDFFDDNGISLVMIHTQKGNDYINKISSQLYCIDVQIDKAIEYNKSIIDVSQPSVIKDKVKEFEKRTGSLYKALDRYYNPVLYRKGLVIAYKKLLAIKERRQRGQLINDK